MRWWLLLGKKALLRRVFAAVIGVLFLCMLKWWWAIYKCVHDTTYNMVGYLHTPDGGGLFTTYNNVCVYVVEQRFSSSHVFCTPS